MTKAMKFTSECDGEIRRLKDDLYQARRTIVCLMPEPVQEILDSYYRCTSRIELHQWESNVIDQLVELAKPVPRHTTYDTERAYCPLCGGSAQSIYQSQQGFSLPVGLQRHLEGWGNTHQCDVTVAAFKLARDWRVGLTSSGIGFPSIRFLAKVTIRGLSPPRAGNPLAETFTCISPKSTTSIEN
jgi:hypothetical protein